MPAAMHSFYLRNLYINNLLRKPGGITLNGVAIDISKSKVPAYFVSTLEDHIAPWKSTYAGARLLSGKLRFVLGGSGHIAGIVNPPTAKKYGYWTNDTLADTPQAWLDGATQHAGSWWNDWAQWVAPYAGVKVAAREPGTGKLKALEDAPGSYVKVKIDRQKAAALPHTQIARRRQPALPDLATTPQRARRSFIGDNCNADQWQRFDSGGAWVLGAATAQCLAGAGGKVVIADLNRTRAAKPPRAPAAAPGSCCRCDA
jgi:hypothetical protein